MDLLPSSRALVCFGWFPCLIVPTLAFGLPSLLWPRPAFIAKDVRMQKEQEMTTSHSAAAAAGADPMDDMETVRTNTSDSVLTMKSMVQEV